jgi:hypothetical protein
MSFLQSVVATVSVKKRRERSLIVTDLEPSTSKTDADSFAAVYGIDLHITPDIVSTKRLGRLVSEQTRPLLAVLNDAEQRVN